MCIRDRLSVAVLQMAIAMDYSIFLLSRFREERANGTDPVVAMTAAVKKAFLSISASSTTTIAGFVALMFMRYTCLLYTSCTRTPAKR